MGKRLRRPKVETGIRIAGAFVVFGMILWNVFPQARVWIVGGVVLIVVGFVWAAMAMWQRKTNAAAQRDSVSVSAPRPRSVPSELQTAASATGPIATSSDGVAEALRRLDWFQFEKVVAAIYRGYGDAVERLGGAHPDGGVDLIVTAKSGKFVVQCKHWCNWTVGVKDIRELLGTLTTSGIPKGVFVTMRGYSDEARDLGVKHGLVLLDQKQLAELIIGLGPTHGAEVLALLNDPRKFCPKCETEMVLRIAKRGVKAGKHFWGCPNFPRCDGTLEADAD